MPPSQYIQTGASITARTTGNETLIAGRQMNYYRAHLLLRQTQLRWKLLTALPWRE
jgi:hypothetical protein